MSEEINTGGTAFPFTPTQDRHQKTQGMSLRDYFAAKAMSGMSRDSVRETIIEDDELFLEKCAIMSYKLADAMLKARG